MLFLSESISDKNGSYPPSPRQDAYNLLARSFLNSTILINSLPSLVLQVSQFENLYQRKPKYTYLKAFSCSSYPYLRYYSSHKLNYHPTKCVFIGYSDMHKDYKCFNRNGQTYITRHVIFDETKYPFSIKTKSTYSSSSTLPLCILRFVQVPPSYFFASATISL